MAMNGQCSYSGISCIGTLVTVKMQIGKLLAKLVTKARLETCGLHHRSPSLVLTLLLVHFCLRPNYRRISQEERKWFAFIVVDNVGTICVKRFPLWQQGMKRSRDTVLFVSYKVTNRKIVKWRERVFVCKQRNRHHRSLCIKTFPVEKSSEMAHYWDPYPLLSLLSSDEQVLMQTATVEVENLQKSRRVTTRLLPDTSSQRTYFTNELAEKLQLPITGSETLTVYTFCASKPRELPSSHWTPAVNKGWIISAFKGQCCTQDNR